MKTKTSALAGLVALISILVAWFVLGRGAGEDGSGLARGPADSVEHATHESRSIDAPLERPGVDDERTDVVTAAAEDESLGAGEGARRSWPAEETRWLEVDVLAPAGTPAEERVRVIALAQALSEPGDHGGLYGEDAPVAALLRGDSQVGEDGLLAATPPAACGRVRVGLPPDAEEVWLVVAGSYLYSLAPIRVELAAAAGPVELRPVLGARITGELLAPAPAASGAPSGVAEVEVSLDWGLNSALALGAADAGSLDRVARTDGAGRFEFAAVPVGKPQTLSTTGSTFARAFLGDIQAAPGDHVRLTLDLVVGGTVRGRIVDEAGEPLAAVEVRAAGREFFGNPTERLRDTESADDGTFELTGLTPGKVWLRVEKDDFQVLLTSPFQLADLEEREHGDVVLSRGFAIAGTVVFPGGRPAEGANVSVQPDLSGNVGGTLVDPRAYIGAGNEATVDAQGAFEITALGGGPWVVAARLEVDEAGAELAAGRWSATRDTVAAPAEGVALTLEPPVAVSGLVLDGTQTPVDTFTIRAERAGSQWYMPPSEERSETFQAEDGRFTLEGLRSGSWTFSAEGEGYARSQEVTLELPSDERISLVLLRPIAISGRVVDPEGQPVAGAEVAEELEGTEVFEKMQGRGDWPVTTSDERGGFSLEGLAPGAGAVVAKKDGFAPSAPVAFELAEGEELADAVLTLRRGGTITGEVYGKDGELAAGCVVILQMPTLAERRFTNTDADGGFGESGLSPGTWQVQAFPGIESLQDEDGGSLDQAQLLAALEMQVVELEDEKEEHVVLGAPPEDPVRVFGSVTLDDEPWNGAIVSFVPTAGGGMGSLKIQSVDDDGRYSLQLDEPGDYLVTVQSAGGAGRQNSIEFRRSVPKGESHQLDFELPLGRVSGRVLGPGGDPLPGARVTLTVQGGLVFGTVFGGQYSEAATDANGEYEVAGLRPGRYTVAAGGALLGGLFGDGAELGRVVQTVEVEEGESVRGVDFRLETPGRVEGTVRNTAGQPVSGASIFLRDEAGNLVELFSLAQTNASGAFEYPGLAPGEYTVHARTSSEASASGVPVRVRAGEASEVTLVVSPGTMLLVSLVDKTGADVRSRISVLDADDNDLNGMLGLTEIMERYSGGLDNTVQRVGPLPPGSYKVQAVAEDGRTTARPVHLTGQPERKLKLRLK